MQVRNLDGTVILWSERYKDSLPRIPEELFARLMNCPLDAKMRHRLALARAEELAGTLGQCPEEFQMLYARYKEARAVYETTPERVAERKRQADEAAARAARLLRFQEEQPVLAQALAKLASEPWFQETVGVGDDGGEVLRDRAVLALARKIMKSRFGTVEACLREFFIESEPGQREWAQMMVDGAPRPADFQKASASWTVDYREVLASICQPETVTTRKKAR